MKKIIKEITLEEDIKEVLENELPLNIRVSYIQAFLDISRTKAYELVNKEIPFVRVGERIVIPRNSFINWYLNNLQLAF